MQHVPTRSPFRAVTLVAALVALAGCSAPVVNDAGTDTTQPNDTGEASTMDLVDHAPADVPAEESSAGCTTDSDHDMHLALECGGDDCNDDDPMVHPGATETCDAANRDEDCDPRTFGFRDNDSDSYADAQCCNSDSTGAMRCGDDCNDNRPNVHPALVEACDGLDNNCDGMVDEGVTRTFHPDGDGDGFGDSSASTMTGCVPPAGYVEAGGDCDDTRSDVHPGALEQCDVSMVDENCDGVANPATLCTCSGDIARPCALSGACAAGTERCVAGSWGSCSIAPVVETCNGVDDDCDGMTDEGLSVTCYADGDNDSYAAASAASMLSCPVAGRDPVGGCPVGRTNRPPSGSDIDCNDADATIAPSRPESCNGRDDDCNGMIDEGVRGTFYRDADGDMWGNDTITMTACTAPAGYVTTSGDCNDASPGVHPGAMEVCNGVDDDCDGITDPGCSCIDGTGRACGTSDGMGGLLMVGACHPGTQTCTAGTYGPCIGNVAPQAESCNGVDDDCDGMVDEGVGATYYRDLDSDGYGNLSMTIQACSLPSGYALVAGDCDDARAAVHPGASEACNGRDDNCDGAVDEGLGATYYRDGDGDGYGVASMSITACSAPAGYVIASTNDCDDTRPAVHPGASDVCNGIDDDCDGVTDPGCSCVNGATRTCGTSDGMGGFLTRGICRTGTQTCSLGAWGTCSGNVAPASETCNGVDDDCDGTIDDGVQTAYTRDCDHDGFGATGTATVYSCATPTTSVCAGGTTYWVTNATDCNDANANIRPGATEACNGIDDDCNGTVDGAPANTWCSAGGAGVPPNTQTAVCSAGVCNPTTCTSGYLNCTSAAGCETNGAIDANNCGACGTVCSGSCAASMCDLPVEIAVGANHACARLTSGAVVCWGLNASGQLGDGTTSSRTVPVRVAGVSGAVSIAAGGAHTCAALASGGVMCWGLNVGGQLGDNTMSTRTSAVSVVGISASAVQVAAGDSHTCARTTTGSVFCWGSNSNGAIGDGTTISRRVATLTVGMSAATDITAGSNFSCAIGTPAGETMGAYCWGSNDNGQIGDGTLIQRNSPTRVGSLGMSLSDISSGPGAYHACAVSGATLSCWGANGAGQLGDGTTADQSTPVTVSGVSSAPSPGVDFTCATGTVGTGATGTFCWGANAYGQLGDGTVFPEPAPHRTGTWTNAVRGGAGNAFACARLATSVVYCWGINTFGQLGNGTTTNSRSPVRVTGL